MRVFSDACGGFCVPPANTISRNTLWLPCRLQEHLKKIEKQLLHTAEADNVPNAQKRITQTAQWVFRSNRHTSVMNYKIQAANPSRTAKATPNTETCPLTGEAKHI